jgi:hypothetical protein
MANHPEGALVSRDQIEALMGQTPPKTIYFVWDHTYSNSVRFCSFKLIDSCVMEDDMLKWGRKRFIYNPSLHTPFSNAMHLTSFNLRPYLPARWGFVFTNYFLAWAYFQRLLKKAA